MNQWCMIEEENEMIIVTFECTGLVVGSSAELVAEHLRSSWDRGQRAIDILGKQLGQRADELCPIVNGGVHLSKLGGVIHDTCPTANLIHDTCPTANLVDRQMRVVRDDCGKELYGVELWETVKWYELGWRDVFRGNHSRNLPGECI
jgi:hypothetical protein